MNITYAGRHGELPPDQQQKLDAKFGKLAKLVDVRGADKGAHVVVTSERHLTNVEITVNFYDHGLVGVGAGPDFFTAMCTALEKLEKQALKVRTKWRDTKRGAKDKTVEGTAGPEIALAGEATETAEAGETEETGVQVFRVNHHERRKPMTLEEAMIAIDGREYMAYRDADKDCVSVLIRRRDGNFDLVES
jgi:putative sigma-54 modulation protein